MNAERPEINTELHELLFTLRSTDIVITALAHDTNIRALQFRSRIRLTLNELEQICPIAP